MLTYILMTLMIIISLATLLWPPLADFVSGVGELTYPWRPWTAVFLHGWPGVPMLPHLAGNLVLLALVGPPVEKHLSKGRFLLLTLLAIAAAGFLRLFSGLEFNGASAFIWAYAPPLWLLIRHGVQTDDKAGLLWIMWLVIPLVMGGIWALNGVNVLLALVGGNAYHLSATAVGFACTWFWQDHLAAPDKKV